MFYAKNYKSINEGINFSKRLLLKALSTIKKIVVDSDLKR
jgi:hypothetical protein